MEALGFGVGDNLGGSVRVAGANARALAARGHEVVFWCTNLVEKGQRLYEGEAHLDRDGVSVDYWDTRTIRRWPGVLGPHWVTLPKSAKRSIREFDVVHLCEFRSFLSSRTGSWAIDDRIPLVMQPQGTFLRRSKQRLLKRAYDILVGGRIAAGASRFVAATQVEAESLRESGIECEKIAIVPNGIELRNAPALPQPGSFRRRINRPSGVPLIVSVGRVDEIKGFDLMLHAMAMVPLPATYVVVGPDHGFGAHLRRLACKLGLESRFVLTGALRDAEDVMAAIVDADVFVLPSRHEAFGQVILEACLASKPMVLSTGVNSAADFADRAALVVPPQPSALAGAVNRLLGDPALCARFGAEGRRMLDCDYRIEAVAAKLERVYESAISRN